MASSSWREQLARCADGREQLITLFEAHDEINVQYSEQGVSLRVQLTHQPLDKRALHAWLRLGQSSLAHFPGAVAQAPASGHLWLLQHVPGHCREEVVFAALEALLNQRDTWRSVFARLARPIHTPNATSLRTLPH